MYTIQNSKTYRPFDPTCRIIIPKIAEEILKLLNFQTKQHSINIAEEILTDKVIW